MDKNVVLKAARRDRTGKKVKSLRREGRLPAVLYGHTIEPTPISLDAHNASLTLAGLSASTVVTIELDGEQHAALVREKQRNYITNDLVHVDFQVISLTERIRTAVPIDMHGTAVAVKENNAVIVQSLTSVEVEALPGDLPERFSVDISGLKEVGDAIYVRDLPVSENVDVLADPDEVVIVATGAAPEEEEEEIEEEVEGTEPEVIERGKREDEEEEE